MVARLRMRYSQARDNRYETNTMSPAYIRELTPQGLQPVPYTADSLQDASQYEPDGIYTVTNTYGLGDQGDRLMLNLRYRFQ